MKLSDVSINAREPFLFNQTRFLFTLGILALAFIFRPKSAIYRIGIVRNPRKSKAALITAVAIEIVLLSSYLFMGSNLVGVATSTYNSGSWMAPALPTRSRSAAKTPSNTLSLPSPWLMASCIWRKRLRNGSKTWKTLRQGGARDELQKETGEEYPVRRRIPRWSLLCVLRRGARARVFTCRSIC